MFYLKKKKELLNEHFACNFSRQSNHLKGANIHLWWRCSVITSQTINILWSVWVAFRALFENLQPIFASGCFLIFIFCCLARYLKCLEEEYIFCLTSMFPPIKVPKWKKKSVHHEISNYFNWTLSIYLWQTKLNLNKFRTQKNIFWILIQLI